MSSLHSVHDEPLKYFSMVTKLVYYTSKFGLNDDGRQSKQQSSTRNRLASTLDLTDKFVYIETHCLRDFFGYCLD